MNPNVRALLERYDQVLEANQVVAVEVIDSVNIGGTEAYLGHLRYMIQRLLCDAESEGWSDRQVNRWLGFIQGVLWSEGIVGILSLRDDSRHLYD